MSRYRYWPFILFLVVLLLPSVAIFRLTQRIASDDQKILSAAENSSISERKMREEAEKESAAAEIGSEIYRQVELIKRERPETLSNPAVAMVGWLEGEHLVWPFDPVPDESMGLRLKEDNPYAQRLEEARRAEILDKYRAAQLYREIVAEDFNARQRAFANLQLAYLLNRSNLSDEAQKVFADLLDVPWSIRDDFNDPFAATAAQNLVKMTGGRDVVAWVQREWDSSANLTLDRSRQLKSILNEILQKSEDGTVRQKAQTAFLKVSARIQDLESLKQSLEGRNLQRDFKGGLGVTESQWMPYGEPGEDLWLVGRAMGGIDHPVIVVVKVENIRKNVEAERLANKTGTTFEIVKGGEAGKPMGDFFPRMRVIFPATAPIEASVIPSRQLGSFWFWFVIPFTLLGGFLLWHDTRREIRISEMRTQFVSSVSHELKTPLTAIRMFAETLQIGGETDKKTHDEYLETIVNESERLTRLLNNVLDFSRIERGQKTYSMAPTSLEEVLDAAVRTMRYPLSAKGFELSVEVCEGIPPVNVDRDAMQQAILNLLANAVKYSGKRRDIAVRLCSENGNALIQVEDHGIGVPPSEQSRIFEKFYRAHVPENRAIAGTGLGLALVAHIAAGHGGTAGVESKPGEGSTFSIRIPIDGGDSV